MAFAIFSVKKRVKSKPTEPFSSEFFSSKLFSSEILCQCHAIFMIRPLTYKQRTFLFLSKNITDPWVQNNLLEVLIKLFETEMVAAVAVGRLVKIITELDNCLKSWEGIIIKPRDSPGWNKYFKKHTNFCVFLSHTGIPGPWGPIYGSRCLSVHHWCFVDLIDVSLVDEDSNSILNSWWYW